MELKFLPDADLRDGNFNRKIDRYGRHLVQVTNEDLDGNAFYFALRVPVTSLSPDFTREVRAHLEQTALQSAAAQLAHAVAPHGWTVHVPMLGRMLRAPHALVPATTHMRRVYDELTKIVEREAADYSNMLHDIGAKGRRREEDARFGTAMAYAVMTQVVPAEKVMQSVA